MAAIIHNCANYIDAITARHTLCFIKLFAADKNRTEKYETELLQSIARTAINADNVELTDSCLIIYNEINVVSLNNNITPYSDKDAMALFAETM